MNETEKKLLSYGNVLKYSKDSIILNHLGPETPYFEIETTDFGLSLKLNTEDRIMRFSDSDLETFVLLKQLQEKNKYGTDTASLVNALLKDSASGLRVFSLTAESIVFKDRNNNKEVLLANGTAGFGFDKAEEVRCLVWNEDPKTIDDLMEDELTEDENGVSYIDFESGDYLFWVFVMPYKDGLAALDEKALRECGMSVCLYEDGDMIREFEAEGYDYLFDMGELRYGRRPGYRVTVEFHGCCTKENYREYYDPHLYLVR